jgi:hypothetical protein
VQVNPLDASCPKCHAPRKQRCIRLTGPYALGTPLRKMHPERFRAAEEQIDRMLESLRRQRSGPGG